MQNPKIMDIMVRGAIVLDLAATQKQDVLLELCEALARAEPSLDVARMVEVLSRREALQTTGIGEGVAIPHGKLPGLTRMYACFARSKAGVDFESIDGGLTHVFFMLMVPDDSGGRHLKALSRISRFFRNAEFRKTLEAAESEADVLRAIEVEDAK